MNDYTKYEVNVNSFETSKALSHALNALEGVQAYYGYSVTVKIYDQSKIELVKKMCLNDYGALSFRRQVLPK